MVRHQVLVLAFGGSNPSALAIQTAGSLDRAFCISVNISDMTKKTRKNTSHSQANDSYPEKTIKIGRRTLHFIADKVIVFRLMRQLHGRFWGVAGLLMMLVGLGVCFAIRPDVISWSTAYSDFGSDVRTAPYLAGSLFFAAYGLWRWRNYLRRTLRHSRPVTWLVGLTVVGFYIAALMPVAWEPWPRRIHMFGVFLSGIAMAATVVADTLLSKTRRGRSVAWWRLLRVTAFALIMVGGFITLGSNGQIRWFDLALLGEIIMFAGYFVWVADKTYRGEGARSRLSKMLHKIVLID